MGTELEIGGVRVAKGALDRAQQAAIVEDVRGIVRVAPLVRPVMPNARAMSVRMTSAGRVGWVTDRGGYRYQDHHPNGAAWPDIPASILGVWRQFGHGERDPDCCLVNYYDADARMGLHQDRDEGDFSWPVVSISLGDAALFRVGGTSRGGPTKSIWLESGDVAVLAGPARLAFHGIDRIRGGSSDLLAGGGRINLTLRVVA